MKGNEKKKRPRKGEGSRSIKYNSSDDEENVDSSSNGVKNSASSSSKSGIKKMKSQLIEKPTTSSKKEQEEVKIDRKEIKVLLHSISDDLVGQFPNVTKIVKVLSNDDRSGNDLEFLEGVKLSLDTKEPDRNSQSRYAKKNGSGSGSGHPAINDRDEAVDAEEEKGQNELSSSRTGIKKELNQFIMV